MAVQGTVAPPDRPRRTFDAVLKDPLFRRALFTGSVVTAILVGIIGAGSSGVLDPGLWTLLQKPIYEGAIRTLGFSVTVIPIGALLGFALGWARVSRHAILSWPAAVYVDLVRGIPVLVLILFAFFWLPTVFGAEDAFESGIFFATLALAIHTGAYQAEIFRAGFQSVLRGQVEAAEAIGLSRWEAMRYVVLPQTFRVTLPALGNEFAVIIKDTSLLSAVGAAELVYWGRTQVQLALGIIEWIIAIWLVIALLYFVVTYIINQVVGAIEHAYRVPGLGTVAF